MSNKKIKKRSKSRGKSLVKEIFSLASENAPTYYVEAYKMLATNIEFIAVAQDCKNIMVTSSVPDEGKTNCAINLALALAGYGKKGSHLFLPFVFRVRNEPSIS